MMSIRTCPECGSKYLIHNNKEVYCSDCGLVVEEYLIDHGQEWRAFDSDQAAKRVRTGPGMTYRVHDKGLSTPTPKLPAGIQRLKWVNMDSSEKTLAFALIEIDRMASALKLPDDVKEGTSMLYRKAAARKLIKGRSIEELVSAMVYITCRQQGIPRTLKEITKVSKMNLKKIRKAYSFLYKKLELKIMPPNPYLYIPRFCAALGLNGTVSAKAIRIIEETESVGSTGLSPISLAAAAIAKAAQELNAECDTKEIAKVAGTTEITIKNNLNKLK